MLPQPTTPTLTGLGVEALGIRVASCARGREVVNVYPLSPVLGGEGRGEGPFADRVSSSFAPHPIPLPRVRGRGDRRSSRRGGRGGGSRRLVQERPAPHPAPVVRIVRAQGDVVLAGLEFAGEVHVPLEAVVVVPPHRVLLAVGDEEAVDVQPRLVE